MTHNKEEKKYKNWKKEIIKLYLGKEYTDFGTEEDNIPVWICTGWQTKTHQKTK